MQNYTRLSNPFVKTSRQDAYSIADEEKCVTEYDTEVSKYIYYRMFLRGCFWVLAIIVCELCCSRQGAVTKPTD